MEDKFKIGKYEFTSRFILGSGKFNLELVKSAIENAGAGHARNEGYKKTVGEYILFLDGDDIFDSDFLYEMYKKITQENK